MAELRAPSQFLDKPKIVELLKSKSDGVLSLTDGQAAYGVPIAYASFHNEALFFGMNPSGRKYEYFDKCKNVSFTVYQTFQSGKDPLNMGWWSIILDGEISQVTNPEDIQDIADTMEKQGKFPPGLKEKILGPILKNPEKSNFFKFKITNYGGKEMPEYRPEDEVK